MSLQRRRELFDRLSEDLAAQLLGKRDCVLCPLCMREFRREQIESELHEEHIIPNSAGAKEITLTCRTCNNILGSQIDSHLARRIRIDCANNGRVAAKAKLRFDWMTVQADHTLRDGRNMNLHLKPSSKYVESKLMEKLLPYRKGEKNFRLGIQSNIKAQEFMASLAKAAYLGLFADWKYGYILMPSLDRVRLAIREDGADRRRLAGAIVPSRITEFSGIPDEPRRLTFALNLPSVETVACSIINLRNDSNAYWVFLPPPDNPSLGGWDGLARAASAVKGKRGLKLDISDAGVVTIHGL